MSILLFITVLAVATSLMYLGEKKNNKYLRISSLLIIILLITFRSSGTDTLVYKQFFIDIVSQPVSVGISRMTHDLAEPLFVLPSILAKYVGYGYRWVFLLHSILIVLFAYLSSRRLFKHNYWLLYSVMLWCIIPLSFNGMRQAAAIMVMFYAATYLIKYKNRKSLIAYGLLSLLALCSHISSLVMACLLFLAFVIYRKRSLLLKLKINWTIIYVTSVISLAAASYAILHSPEIVSWLLPYRYYGTLEEYGIGIYISYNYILMAITLAVGHVLRKKLKLEHGQIHFMLVIALLGLVPVWFSSYVGRLTDYFLPLTFTALITYFMIVAKAKLSSKNMNWIILAGAVSYFILNYVIMGNGDIFPFSASLNGVVL